MIPSQIGTAVTPSNSGFDKTSSGGGGGKDTRGQVSGQSDVMKMLSSHEVFNSYENLEQL